MKMKYILIIFLSTFSFLVSSQGEQLLPLTSNPALMIEDLGSKNVRSGSTFDSTFIYLPDTLALPLIDDFSTDKFQNYEVDFSGTGVSSVKEYRLLDLGGTPLPNNVLYTQQQTFTRYYDIGNGVYYDTLLPTIDIQVGDQSSYPTVYNTVTVYPPYYIYDTLDFVSSPDTIWIYDAEIFQDSATQFFDTIVDAEYYWIEREAFRNFGFADNPWTLGVATFDGLDEKGYPYAINTTTSNFADHLTSKPIDMTSVAPNDSVYLSFIYQAEGLGEIPESGDSLILEFYDAGTGNWNQVWSAGGQSTSDFKIGHIKITQAAYFSNAFQFRFKNWGALYGNLDHFHLDYVKLRNGSSYTDTVFGDVAFSYPIYSLLKDYTSVPWDHYVNLSDHSSVMSDSLQIVMSNRFPGPVNAQDGTLEVFYNGVSEGIVVPLISDILCNDPSDNYQGYDTPYSYHDVQSFYAFDPTKLGAVQEFEIRSKVQVPPVNFNGNDSTATIQRFINYYSYDDGSAERVYGTNEALSQIAVRYDPYEVDSLIGVQISFIPHENDMSNELFLVTVWSDLNGEPDTIIYQDDQFFPRTPIYKPARNRFATYYFTDTMKVHVNGPFHIGFKQLSSGVYGLGFDRNIDNSDKNHFFSPAFETWNQSSFSGSFMIRPVFSTSYDSYLGVPEVEHERREMVLYPNPVKDILNINFENKIESVTIIDYTGKVVLRSELERIDVSHLTSGLYFVQVNESGKLGKFIKE